MIEELKYTLLNLYSVELGCFERFNINNDYIKVLYNNIWIEGYEDKIVIYFDESLYFYPKTLQYLTKKNTLKIFTKVSVAMEYLHYLLRATKDVRFELYHYFLFKLKEIKFEYTSSYFSFTNNQSLETLVINFSISDIKFNNKTLNYTIHTYFFKDNVCELSFHPKNSLWGEGKICPEIEVNKILWYLENISFYEYGDIPLKEI